MLYVSYALSWIVWPWAQLFMTWSSPSWITTMHFKELAITFKAIYGMGPGIKEATSMGLTHPFVPLERVYFESHLPNNFGWQNPWEELFLLWPLPPGNSATRGEICPPPHTHTSGLLGESKNLTLSLGQGPQKGCATLGVASSVEKVATPRLPNILDLNF